MCGLCFCKYYFCDAYSSTYKASRNLPKAFPTLMIVAVMGHVTPENLHHYSEIEPTPAFASDGKKAIFCRPPFCLATGTLAYTGSSLFEWVPQYNGFFAVGAG